jgi:intracellular proteinase inhibitor BsuPI
VRALDPATGLGVQVDVVPDPPHSGERATWTFTLANHGRRPCALTFTSAQQGDVVLTARGEERYRWSGGMMFAAMVTERELAAGEEWRFSLEAVLPVEPGEYSLLATVTARPSPPAVRADIAVLGRAA